MTYYIGNFIGCLIGAAFSLWGSTLDGGGLLLVFAITWMVFMGTAGYWLIAILDGVDERAENATINQMTGDLERAGVYSDTQAAAVRRELLEQ